MTDTKSDLPDEIVERVALVLCKNANTPGLSWNSYLGRAYWKELARAALTASGWAEMREALNSLLKTVVEDLAGL